MADKAELQILIKARNEAKKEFDALNKQVNALSGKTGGGGSGIAGLSKQFTSLVKTIGASVVLKQFIDFAYDATSAASDLNETLSKTRVVFGKAADSVIGFGSDAARSLGMSQNAATAAAATYGNLFRSMDMAEEKSASMSVNLVQLAGDLASFNNLDPSQVFEKLRAGLTGEAEPLKSLGININETIIKTKAMELDLYDGVGAIDAASKASAAYELMLEQTTLAQGDFARTSEGFANQQRILAANFEDLKAVVGEYGQEFGEWLIPQLNIAIDSFKGLITMQDTWESMVRDAPAWMSKSGISYEDYTRRVLDTATSVGNLSKREKERYEYYSQNMNNPMNLVWLDKMNDKLGIVTQTTYEASKIGIDPWVKAWEDAKENVIEDVKLSEEEIKKLADEQNKLAGNMISIAGQMESINADYIKSLEEIANDETLTAEERITATKKVEEAKNLATQKIILGYAQQILAADELTIEEAEALLAQGVQWGIYSQTAVDEMMKVINQAGGLAGAIGAIPTSKTITITTIYESLTRGGTSSSTAKQIAEGVAAGNIAPSNPTRRANGGNASGLTLVGERGPELVDMPYGSRVYNNEQSRNMMGGTTVIVNYSPLVSLSDRTEIKTKLVPLIKEAMRS